MGRARSTTDILTVYPNGLFSLTVQHNTSEGSLLLHITAPLRKARPER